MADPLIRREEDGHLLHPPGRSLRKGKGFRKPRCQVEGCMADLNDSKAYYSKHKVCNPHSKSPQVIVNGLHQRFCQQCSRFHLLHEFDSEKRSCRRRLAGHNERRRKPAPGSLPPSRYPRLSSSASDRGSSRSPGFHVELASPYPRPQSTLWPSIPVQGTDQGTPTGKPLSWQHSPYVMFMPNLASSDLIGFAGQETHSEVCFTGVTAESSRALSLLSNQSWDSRNQASSSLGTSNVTRARGSCKTAEAPAPAVHDERRLS